jgi:hypothetical protein
MRFEASTSRPALKTRCWSFCHTAGIHLSGCLPKAATFEQLSRWITTPRPLER